MRSKEEQNFFNWISTVKFPEQWGFNGIVYEPQTFIVWEGQRPDINGNLVDTDIHYTPDFLISL